MTTCRIATLCCLVLFASASCSNQTRRVQHPDIDPAESATKAMAQYDANGDAQLDDNELANSAISLKLWDTDGDGAVTQPEITQRLGQFVDSGVGMSAVIGSVSWQRAPLPGAKVVFEPEAFLGEGMLTASGTTDESGETKISVADEFLPHPNMKGIQPGLYRVRITHPEVNLPDVYNTNSTLTFESSPVDNLPDPKFDLVQ